MMTGFAFYLSVMGDELRWLCTGTSPKLGVDEMESTNEKTLVLNWHNKHSL